MTGNWYNSEPSTDDIVDKLRVAPSCWCDEPLSRWDSQAERYEAAGEIERLRKERTEYADEIYRLRAAIDEVLAETYGDHQPELAGGSAKGDGKDSLRCRFCRNRDGIWPCAHRLALDALKKARRD